MHGTLAPDTMHLLNLTLGTPAENLALDEALWEACEGGGPEVLRFWESPLPFVVLGYANRIATEVNLEACRQRSIPVLRRISGGGTVLQGSGCLNYAVVLRLASNGPTANVSATNLHIMNRHAAALAQALGRPVRRRGDTDLAIGDQKFSGNAQRRGRHALLFHGTILCHGDLELMEAVLPPPSRQPDYRAGRSHAAFVYPLGVPTERVQDTLSRAWQTRWAPPHEPPVRSPGFSPSQATPPAEAGTTSNGSMAGEPVRTEHGALPAAALSGSLELHAVVAHARALARTKYGTHAWTCRF